MKKRKKKDKKATKAKRTEDAFFFLEQAVFLLQHAPLSAWVWYWAGTLPFMIALTLFLTLINESGSPDTFLVTSAFPVGLLYVWMKGCQAKFSLRLWQGVGEPVPDPDQQKGLWLRQMTLHPFGLFAVQLSHVLLIPYPLFASFFQNQTVLEALPRTDTKGVTHQAWSLASKEQLGGLVFLSLGKPALFLLAALNWITVLVMVPLIGYSISGIENPFVTSFNTFNTMAFWMAVWALTYITVDPLLKAMYLLRAERTDARQSGSDLRRRFQATSGTTLRCGLLMACLGLFAPAPVQGAEAEELGPIIEEVSQHPNFVWRMPPELLPDGEATLSPVALWIQEQLEALDAWMEKHADTIARWWRKWFGDETESDIEPISSSGFAGMVDLAEGVMILLVVVLLVFIIALLIKTWQQRQRVTAEEVSPAPAAEPDLTREDVLADELPADDWLNLADDLQQRGEFRLALRAMFLAFLARLADRNLLVIRRAKSNRDYERELRTRGGLDPALLPFFGSFRRQFDCAWYGNYPVEASDLSDIRNWLDQWGTQS